MGIAGDLEAFQGGFRSVPEVFLGFPGISEAIQDGDGGNGIHTIIGVFKGHQGVSGLF